MSDLRICGRRSEKSSNVSVIPLHELQLVLLRQHVLHTLDQVIHELLLRLSKLRRRPSEEKVWITIVEVKFDGHTTV